MCESGKAIRRYVCSGVRWIEGEGLWGDRIRDNFTPSLTNTYTLPHIYIYIYIIVSTLRYLLFVYKLYFVCIHTYNFKETRYTRTKPHSFATYELQVTTSRFSRVLIYYALRIYINELLVYVYVLQAQTSYKYVDNIIVRVQRGVLMS